MKNFGHRLAAVALAAFSVSANALVVDFESPGPSAFVTTTLQGFAFGNLNIATTNWFTDTEVSQGATFYQAQSGTKLAFHVNAPTQLFILQDSDPITRTDALPFTFDGAWFSGTEVQSNPVQVSYKLYNDAVDPINPVHQSALTSLPLTDGPALFVASGWTEPITRIVIYGHSGYYGMDDFTATPVPEPATYALLLAGMGVVGFAARRRAQQR